MNYHSILDSEMKHCYTILLADSAIFFDKSLKLSITLIPSHPFIRLLLARNFDLVSIPSKIQSTEYRQQRGQAPSSEDHQAEIDNPAEGEDILAG